MRYLILSKIQTLHATFRKLLR